ncbi:peptidase C15, pyroglutamyl peptidase I-like protein [Ceratobasidium sp. AG-I]|nr:peptidase C15, pyroglutamyl peptidase I-like protein [Ceratobasidium sp. AG-I]
MSSTKPLRVLVTGFGPFQHITTNPSWLAVSGLNNKTLSFSTDQSVKVEAHISALQVPVSYSAVLNRVPALHSTNQYDVILHVGVGESGAVMIEKLAHKTGYSDNPEYADADGKLCKDVTGVHGFGQGYEGFNDVLETSVNVDQIVEHLHSKGLKDTRASDDPGHFVCDFIYYCSLACAQKDGGWVKVLFMHVPPVGEPYQVEEMTQAVEGVIEYLALHT